MLQLRGRRRSAVCEPHGVAGGWEWVPAAVSAWLRVIARWCAAATPCMYGESRNSWCSQAWLPFASGSRARMIGVMVRLTADSACAAHAKYAR